MPSSAVLSKIINQPDSSPIIHHVSARSLKTLSPKSLMLRKAPSLLTAIVRSPWNASEATRVIYFFPIERMKMYTKLHISDGADSPDESIPFYPKVISELGTCGYFKYLSIEQFNFCIFYKVIWLWIGYFNRCLGTFWTALQNRKPQMPSSE